MDYGQNITYEGYQTFNELSGNIKSINGLSTLKRELNLYNS